MGKRLGVLALTGLLLVFFLPQSVYPGILPPPNPGDAPDAESPQPWGPYFIIESDPPGATIIVDGDDGGKTPRRLTYVAVFHASRTVFELRKDGYLPCQVIIDFTAKNPEDQIISKSPGVQATRIRRFFYEEFTIRAVLPENERTAYENAQRENTAAAYRQFAERHPDTIYTDDARARLVEAQFRDAERLGTVEAFRDFLGQAAGATSGAAEILRRTAQQRQAELAFAEARRADRKEGYEQYLRDYPNAPQAYETKARLIALQTGQREADAGAEASAYAEAKRLNTESAYQDFLRRFPQSLYATDVAARQAELEFQAAERQGTADAYRQYIEGTRGDTSAVRTVLRREAERQFEALVYARAKKANTIRDYEQFAAAHPRSLFAAEAKDRASLLREQVKMRLESGQRLQEQGNYPDAILQYQVVTRLDPGNADAYFRLASLLARERKLDDARREIQSALDLDPNNAAYRVLLDQINRSLQKP